MLCWPPCRGRRDAPFPSLEPARRVRILGGLVVRTASRRVIGWWKFQICKLCAVQLLSADGPKVSLILHPSNFKQLWVLAWEVSFAGRKQLDRYDVSTVKAPRRFKMASDVVHIYDAHALDEETARPVNPGNLARDIQPHPLRVAVLITRSVDSARSA